MRKACKEEKEGKAISGKPSKAEKGLASPETLKENQQGIYSFDLCNPWYNLSSRHRLHYWIIY